MLFLGALRSAAQMVSYEVSLGVIIITVLICAGSLNLSEIVLAQQDVWYAVPLFPMFIMFYISALAETNRHPFDLPEAEAELVSGYNVEYSAMGFDLTFIPGIVWLGLKSLIFVYMFVIVRGILPRYRYDQLMRLGWKVFLPISLGFFFLLATFLISVNAT